MHWLSDHTSCLCNGQFKFSTNLSYKIDYIAGVRSNHYVHCYNGFICTVSQVISAFLNPTKFLLAADKYLLRYFSDNDKCSSKECKDGNSAFESLVEQSSHSFSSKHAGSAYINGILINEYHLFTFHKVIAWSFIAKLMILKSEFVYSTGMEVLKVTSSAIAKQYGLNSLPAIVFFRNANPVIYFGTCISLLIWWIVFPFVTTITNISV